MVHGPTGTGKSRSTLYFVDLIKEYINIPVIFCPTNRFHNDWTGIVPKCMIRDKISLEAIQGLIDNQEEKNSYTEVANTLTEFWDQLPGNKEIDAEYGKNIKLIDERIAQNKTMMSPDDYAKAEHDKYVAGYHRNTKSRELIYKHIAKLYRRHGVNRKEPDMKDRTAINLLTFHKYFRLNNNMLLVIDDCTDQFKSVPDETWKLIFNKSRHFKITIIMGTHNLGDIKVQCLRTAPFWQIFMTSSATLAYMNNGTVGLKGVLVVDPNSLAKAFNHDKEKGTMTRVALSRDRSIVVKFTYPLALKFQIGDKVLWQIDDILQKRKTTQGTMINPDKL